MTKSDQLSGVRAKIKRAKHHVHDLCATVKAFRERNPDLVICEKDADTGSQVFKANLVEPIPLEWSMIIGDCAHNLRTALDYVIQQAVIAGGGQPSNRTGFPIRSSQKKFESDLTGKVKGASEKTRQLVRRLKPYPTGREPFWIISELDITDKHQTVIPVWAYFPSVHISKIVAGTITEIGHAESPFPVHHGAELLSTTNNNQDWDIQLTLEIAFAKGEVVEGEPIIPTLYQLVQFTDRVVDIFARHIFHA